MIAGEEPAGPPETCLDLIRDEENPVAGTDVADLSQVTFRWDDHSRFPLNRLYEKSGGLRGDRRFQSTSIAIRDRDESGGERAKPITVQRLRRESDNRDRPPVKVP